MDGFPLRPNGNWVGANEWRRRQQQTQSRLVGLERYKYPSARHTHEKAFGIFREWSTVVWALGPFALVLSFARFYPDRAIGTTLYTQLHPHIHTHTPHTYITSFPSFLQMAYYIYSLHYITRVVSFAIPSFPFPSVLLLLSAQSGNSHARGKYDGRWVGGRTTTEWDTS